MSSNLKAVVFDFDGVIIDSTSVKTEAFVDTYADCSEDVKRYVREYHEANQGRPRQQKIEHFAAVIGERSSIAIADRVDRFAELVFDKVMQSVLFEGVVQGLNDLSSSHRLFVASATPQSELTEILKRKNLTRFFETAWGHPTRKADAILSVLQRHQLHHCEIIMIGDSAADRVAAHEAGVEFLGVSLDGKPHPFPADCPVSFSFSALCDSIKRHSSNIISV